MTAALSAPTQWWKYSFGSTRVKATPTFRSSAAAWVQMMTEEMMRRKNKDKNNLHACVSSSDDEDVDVVGSLVGVDGLQVHDVSDNVVLITDSISS